MGVRLPFPMTDRALYAILRGQILHRFSRIIQTGFFYSLNVRAKQRPACGASALSDLLCVPFVQ